MGENGTRKGLGDYQGATPVQLQKAERSNVNELKCRLLVEAMTRESTKIVLHSSAPKLPALIDRAGERAA
jgi:hypothetical protein